MVAQQDGSNGDTDTIPTPIVIIDQDSDQDATVVEITFGDRLGALLDTVQCYVFVFTKSSLTFHFWELFWVVLSVVISYNLHWMQMNALKNLGLNVVKANVFLDSSGKHNRFSITKA